MEIEKKLNVFAVQRGKPLSDNELYQALSYVCDKDKKRILSFRNWRDQQSALIATILSKKGLALLLDVPFESITIIRDKFGRPVLASPKEQQLDFNITHSGEWIICAFFKNGRIGIDIEEIAPLDLNIVRTCLSNKEIACMNTLPIYKRTSYFYDAWTLKEAYTKAIGTGLNQELRKLHFQYQDKKIQLESNNHFSSHYFFNYLIDERYSFSLCLDTNIKPTSLKVVDRNNLLLICAIQVRYLKNL